MAEQKPKRSFLETVLLKTRLATEVSSNAEPAPAQVAVEQIPTASIEAGATGKIKGIVDSNIKATIERELQNFNETDERTRGIDFHELKQAVEVANGATTESKVESAFKMLNAASGGKLTKAHLLATAKLYQSVLEAEIEGFEAHVKTMREEEVGPQEHRARALREENDAIEKQIEELNQRRSANIVEINKLDGEIISKSRNIEQQSANFEATMMAVAEEHNAVVSAIEALPDPTPKA